MTDQVDERSLAETWRDDFRATKRGLLRDCGRERIERAEVVKRLTHRYEVLLRRFLKIEGTTYGTWLEHGPKDELVELLEAARDPATWDRLVETYERRFERP